MTVWIHRRPAADVDADVAAADPALPLAGLRLGVKDNIDVAGMPTTAACPAYAYDPEHSAPVVDRLIAAGAVVVGKTNLDQFATGLVGTRSPHGATPSPLAPERVSGGSSSGSALAVALGEADIALGTDTAGSGRVPAAFCGIVGIKPTPGWLSTRGVVPACRSFDCVSMFARDVVTAARATELAAGDDPADAWSRPRPEANDRPVRRIGVPAASALAGCDPEVLAAFAAIDLSAFDAVVEVDITAYLEAGALLYDGALVAERYAAVGAFIDAHPEEVDPTVGAIIGAARHLPAHRLIADLDRLAEHQRAAEATWERVDAVVLPTAPRHPTTAAVRADPVGANAELGRFTNGCNLLGWCAAAVPVGAQPFGVTVLGPGWSDHAVWHAAATIAGQVPPPTPPTSDRILLAVCGAHLEGQPLNHQLTGRGAELVARTATAPRYRMVRLDTHPPKPGVVKVADGGAPLEVEVWALGAAAFGTFVDAVPAPLAIGTIELADGSAVNGFLCETHAADHAEDITVYGSWRAFLAGER